MNYPSFELIKEFYTDNRWTLDQVKVALNFNVITQEQYEQIVAAKQ